MNAFGVEESRSTRPLEILRSVILRRVAKGRSMLHQSQPRYQSRTALAMYVTLFVLGSQSVAVEIFDLSGPDGARTVEGRVVVEGEDGGVLLEQADERLELIPAELIQSRQTRSDSEDEESLHDHDHDIISQRLLAELPQGFEVLQTKHYIVCFDTTRGYAQWCASLFERLHDAFQNYWKQAGLELVESTRPHIVVIFSTKSRYVEESADELGPAAENVVGYYNLMSNRVVTFDLTGMDLLNPRGGGSRNGLEILRSPAAAGLVATLVHEATHQMAFNCGMHQRLAPIPLWVSEGLAMYFETPDLESARGWRGVGQINRPRLDHWRTHHRAGAIEKMMISDELFRIPRDALDLYAESWALTYFLLKTRKPAFVEYMRILGQKPSLSEDSSQQRREDFHAAFGVDASELEIMLERFMTKVR
jgi:hypothetical protein